VTSKIDEPAGVDAYADRRADWSCWKVEVALCRSGATSSVVCMGVVGRILLGLMAAFCVLLAVLVMGPKRHSRRRDALISYTLGPYVGALGVMFGLTAIVGHWFGWAARGTTVLILLPMTAVSIWGVSWTLRMAFARRLPPPEFDAVESALKEGPAEALLSKLISMLPKRLVLLIGSVFFGAFAYGLGMLMVRVAIGGDIQEPEQPKSPSGPGSGLMPAVSNAWDVFEVLAWVVWVAALIAVALWMLLHDRDFGLAVFVLVLAGVSALGLYIGYWSGQMISPTEAVRMLVDWVGG
jgi:hypothetical protein